MEMKTFSTSKFLDTSTTKIAEETGCTVSMVVDSKDVVRDKIRKLEYVMIGDNQLVLTYKYREEI